MDSGSRCQLRLLLVDASDCTEGCGDVQRDEVYWTHADVLDAAPGWRQVRAVPFSDVGAAASLDGFSATWPGA